LVSSSELSLSPEGFGSLVQGLLTGQAEVIEEVLVLGEVVE
jgi:hypothetical protein